ncbi:MULTISPECIES: InlB B-repeat-containing protein, partial [unclassified Adlercreutzia]|uniref:InlB B-repeat-containing protein n=1 Tax=unclassified Adlercreutzia TaxID=2636013 RepID=UPI0013EB80AB
MFERIIDARGTLEGKVLSVFLSVVLVLSMTNVFAFAEADANAGTTGEPQMGQAVVENSEGVRIGEAEVTFNLTNAYVEVRGQKLTGPDVVTLKVSDSADLVFKAIAENGYEVVSVKAKNSAAANVPVTTQDGTYTIAAEYVNNTLEVTVETELAELAEPTPSVTDALTGDSEYSTEEQDSAAEAEGTESATDQPAATEEDAEAPEDKESESTDAEATADATAADEETVTVHADVSSPAFEDWAYVDDVIVKVTAGEGILPEGTTVQASRVERQDVIDAVSNKVETQDKELQDAVAIDVTLLDKDGNVIQPDGAVNVCFFDADLQGSQIGVYRVSDDAANVETIGARQADPDVQSFDVDHFTIYVVAGSTENKYVSYAFYKGDTEINKQFVRVGDMLYQPSVQLNPNEKFKGWKVGEESFDGFGVTTEEMFNGLNGTLQDNVNNVKEVRVDADIAQIVKINFIQIINEEVDGVTTEKEVIVDTQEGEVNATVPYADPQIDVPAGQAVVGFSTVKGASNAEYDLFGEIKCGESDINLYAVVKNAHWITYDVDGGSPVESQFVLSGGRPVQPADPTKPGYKFDGWINSETNEAFSWNAELTEDVALRAQWTPDQANVLVIYWKQRLTDDVNAADDQKTYDYWDSLSGTAQTGSTLDASQYVQQKSAPTGFKLNEIKSDSSVEVKADGSTIVNVKYDRVKVTVNFKGGRQLKCGKEAHEHRGCEWGYTCGKETHRHNAQNCGLICSKEEHTHGIVCKILGCNVKPHEHEDGCYACGKEAHEHRGCEWEHTCGKEVHSHVDGCYESVTRSYTGLFGAPLPEGAWDSSCFWKQQGSNDGAVLLTSFDLYTAGYKESEQDKHKDHSYTFAYNRTPSSNSNSILYYNEQYNGSFVLAQTVRMSSDTLTVQEKYEGYELFKYARGAEQNEGKLTRDWWDNKDNAYEGLRLEDFGSVSIASLLKKYSFKYYDTGTPLEEVTDVKYTTPLSGFASYRPSNPPEGKTFDCWCADPGLTTPFDFSTTMPNENVAVYVKWKAETYTVEFVNGESTLSSQKVEYGEKATAPQSPVKEGYYFGGWQTSDGIVFNSESPVKEGRTYYAHWIPKGEITVQYMLDKNTESSIEDPNSYRGSANAIVRDGSSLKKDNEKFLYWTENSDGSGEALYAGDRISMETAQNGVVKLYAKFGPQNIAATLTYDANNGTDETYTDNIINIEQASVKSLESVDFTAPDGYTFAGWNTAPDGEGTYFAAGNPIYVNDTEVASNKLYAIWLKIEADDQEYTYDAADHEYDRSNVTVKIKHSGADVDLTDQFNISVVEKDGQGTTIKNAGTLEVTVVATDKVTGLIALSKDVKVTITRAPLKVTTESASREYNGQPLTAPGEVAGLQGGEEVTFS